MSDAEQKRPSEVTPIPRSRTGLVQDLAALGAKPGSAENRLMRQRDLVDFAAAWLAR